MSIVKEFKEFAMRGNMVDMAVGIIIGGAFGKIVSSLVADIIMPLIGKATGNVSFVDKFINLSDDKTYNTLAEAQEAGATVFAYGNFIQNVLDFLIIAICIFFMIKGINRMKQHEEEAHVIAVEVSNKILTKDGQAKTQEKKAEEKADKKLSVKEEKKEDLTVSEGKRMFERMKKEAKRIGNEIDKWCDNHMSFVELILVLLFSWPLWLLIRHSPAIPDLRLSECFVAMVYISNMLTIYGLIPVFLCLSLKTEIIFSISTLILAVIAIKQLSGYSYLNTIWRMLVAIIPFFFMILFLFAVGYVVLLAYAYFKFI
jgi:large conductance mechanosensitive channel